MTRLNLRQPLIESMKGSFFMDSKRSLKLENTLRKEKVFQLCGPSDDPEQQTAVAIEYHYMVTQIKALAGPYLSEPDAVALAGIEVDVHDIYSVYAARANLHALLPEIEEAINYIESDAIENKNQTGEDNQAPYWLTFSDVSGELILNDIFTLATPSANQQNYRIIRYLIANPNRFVTESELTEKALDGKDLDKRLTDFAVQVNINKDLGKLFFDTSKDNIRLNNPITPERMAEMKILRPRIKAG